MPVSIEAVTREGHVPLWGAATFDGRPGTVGVARDFASAFLERARGRHGVPVPGRVVDAVRLVVSELIANADKYAPGPFLLDLELTRDFVRVAVWDTDPALPRPRESDPARIGQHGLEIVLALCEDFGVERRAGGKRIYARIPLGPSPV
jgi:hypothetical protein